jgi:hypothetical protein
MQEELDGGAGADVPALAVSVTMERPPATPDAAATIRKWMDDARIPSWLRTGFEQWKTDRDYVHTALFAAGSPNIISVNLAARVIQAKLSAIIPTDADCHVTAERSVGSVDQVRRDAIRRLAIEQKQVTGATQLAPLLLAAEEAERKYRLEVEAIDRFSQTAQALDKKLFDEAQGTQKERKLGLRGMTVGLAWVKIGWQADYTRDSLGRSRNNDATDQMGLLAVRAAQYAEGIFGQTDPEYGELMHLTRYARRMAQAQMEAYADGQEVGSDPRLTMDQWGGLADLRDDQPAPSRWLPEPDVWRGPTINLVDPECMRWDWRTNVSDWQESPWIIELVLMDVDEAAAAFGLTPEEMAKIRSLSETSADSGQRLQGSRSGTGYAAAADPDNRDMEAPVQLGKVVVYERFCRATHRHSVFIPGIDRLLVDEIPEMVTPWFYPYWMINFNALDGANLPVSEVSFLRKVCDAINQRLTDSEESLWASMKRYLVKRGAFKEGELEKLKGARPHDIIECDDPDEVRKTFHEIASDDWNPAKYDLEQLFRLLELVTGMSLSQLGLVNVAKYATEAAIADDRSREQAHRHAIEMADCRKAIMTAILHYAVPGMSQETVRSLVGQAAYWPPPPRRDDMLRRLRIRIDTAASRAESKEKAGENIKNVMEALNMALDLDAKAKMQGVDLDLQPLVSGILKAIDSETPVRDVWRFDKASMPTAQPPALPGPATQPQLNPPGMPPGGTMPGTPTSVP